MNKDARDKELIELKLDIGKKAAARWSERKEFCTDPKSFLSKNIGEKALMKERYDNSNIREVARSRFAIVLEEPLYAVCIAIFQSKHING